MNSQQESMPKVLREEQDVRFQNQGEVNILRKRIERYVSKSSVTMPLLLREILTYVLPV